MKVLRPNIVCFFLLAVFSPLQGQDIGIPLIKHFSKKIYRAGNQTWDITQDNRGVIYFANNEGVLEYDGSSWHVYPVPNKTIVRSIAINNNGEIYVGGQDEIGVFKRDKNGMLKFNSIKELLPPEHRQFEDVWDIVLAGESLFFRTSDKVFQITGKEVMIYNGKGNLTFLGKAREQVLLHDDAQGLMVYGPEGFTTVRDGARLKNMVMTGIIEKSPDIFMITTLKEGIFTYDQKDLKAWELSVSNFLKKNRIYNIAKINGDKLAIGTSQSGIVILDNSGNPLTLFSKEHGLQNNNVLSVFEDRSGNIWTGLDNGIDFIAYSSALRYVYPDGNQEGTAYALEIFEDNIYFGNSNGLFRHSWGKSVDPFEPNPFTPVSGTSGQVWGLKKIGPSLFLGHHDGAFLINGTEASRIGNSSGVWHFELDNQNPDIIIAGTYSGLTQITKSANTYVEKGMLKGHLESSRIFVQDKAGTYWMAHPYRGVYRIEADLEKGTTEVKFFDKSSGLPSNNFNHVFTIAGNPVFTSEKGIYRFNKSNERFEPDLEFQEYFSADTQIKRLIEDKTGNIWFVADHEVGVLKVEDKGLKKEIKKVTFPELRGKMVGGFELIYPVDDDQIFFGSNEAFIYLNLNRLSSQNTNFNVILSEVKLTTDRDSVIFGGAYQTDNGVTTIQPENQIPVLIARQNALRFSFSASYFEDQDLLQYQYFLKGLEENWGNWTSIREKEYSNLNPGTYTLHVRARVMDKAPTSTITYKFVIAPPWYATRIAYGVYGAVGLLGILGLILVPRHRFKREKAMLEWEQQKIKDDYQKVVNESEKVITDLKNENLVAEVRHKNKELATATMHLVQKGEILTQIKTELSRIKEKSPAPEFNSDLRKIIRIIDQGIELDNDWEQFSYHFDQVHSDFLKRLREKYPNLTPKDHKLCAYLRMNLTTKDIAPLLNISVRGVEISRYRLRKKLGITRETNLVDFLFSL